MKIKIFQVAKTKEKNIALLIEEFVKRLGPYAEIEMKFSKEILASRTFSVERVKEEEGVGFLKFISESDFVVALDEKGTMFSSREFALFLGKYKDLGRTVVFVIGGAFGLSAELKERADLLLSFSKMTFPHEMIRLFLVEQIYRGISIVLGRKYHND